jgi:hypothetical protein
VNPDNATIKMLMMGGFDQAFMAQVGKLYQIYLSNVTGGVREPEETTKRGIENAIEAYRVSVRAVNGWNG